MLFCFLKEMDKAGISFKNLFRYRISKIGNDIRVEIDVINNKGKLNYYYE